MGGNIKDIPGISTGFAFQSFQPQTNLPPATQVRLQVDAFNNALVCEPVQLTLGAAERDGGPNVDSGMMILNVTSPSCNTTDWYILPSTPESPLVPDFRSLPINTSFGQFTPFSCGRQTDNTTRGLLWVAQMEWFTDKSVDISECYYGTACADFQTRGRLVKSSQLICYPTYSITTVDIVQNGTHLQSLTLSTAPPGASSSNRTLEHVAPWSILDVLFATHAFDPLTASGENATVVSDRTTIVVGDTSMVVDPYMATILATQLALDTGLNLSSLYDLSFLQQMATSYYSQFGAVVAKQYLMENVLSNVTGSAVVMTERLVVREWAGQWMAGLVLACLLLTLLALFMVPKRPILPCCPSSFGGLTTLIASSPELLRLLQNLGDTDEKAMYRLLGKSVFQAQILHESTASNRHLIITAKERPELVQQMQSKHSHPGLLHPATYFTICLALVGLVVALEVTLSQSAHHNGVGDIGLADGSDTYIHYLWTALPSLVFGGFSMVFSALDQAVRSFAPYIILSRVTTAHIFLDLDFMDMTIPHAIYKQAKFRNFWSMSITTALLIASLFTTFSSSLFQAVSMPKTESTTLELHTTFANNTFNTADFNSNSKMALTAAWILEGNMSYPQFTYEDLTFPQLSLATSEFATAFSNESTLSIRTKIPALRPLLTCRMYDSTKVAARNYSSLPTHISHDDDPVAITIDGEANCPPWNQDSVDNRTVINTSPKGSYFGLFSNKLCSTVVFAWGQLDYNNSTLLKHAAAMGCNQTLEAVYVDTTFVGLKDLSIDSLNPPRPLEDTAKTSDELAIPRQAVSDIYGIIPPIQSTELLADVFGLLTTSRWAVPVSMLGDPAHDDDVAKALNFQHGILIAQALNSNRAPINNNSSSNLLSTLPGGIGPFAATVSDATGRRRVVQNAVSTRVLEALLVAALLLLVAGRLAALSWRTDVLPARSPTMLAGTMALLAGGNVLDRMTSTEPAAGREADEPLLGNSVKDGVRGLQRGTRIWLGWGTVPDEEGIEMGNENLNGVSRFGIFAMD